MESFFAAIEAGRRPELAGKPVVVAKSAGSTSGVVVSVSFEARASGVSEAMTVRHAGRICPDAVFVPADYALYRSVSSEIMDIFSRYSPLVEPEALDRAWVDVTGSRRLFGGPRKIAVEAMRAIGETGYIASAGIASSKLVAQVASGAHNVGAGFKPALKIVAPRDESAFLAPLSVDLLPGVGSKTSRRLFELGVKTIGQLAAIPEKLLIRQFGEAGGRLRGRALGIDHGQVRADWPPEVINIEHMFPDPLFEPAEVEEKLRPIADRLAIELRVSNRLAETISLVLRNVEAHVPTPDTQHLTPAVWRLKRPVNHAPDILFALKRLLPMQMKPDMEVIGVNVALSDLTVGEGVQLSLLGAGERRRRLDRLVEVVRERFGDGALIYASSLTASGRERAFARIAERWGRV